MIKELVDRISTRGVVKDINRFILTFFFATTFFLAPVVILASTAELSPTVSDISKQFSEKFCASIGNGITPEKAGEVAATQLSKNLLFTPAMKEIISAPKEELAASLSKNIFDGCGNALGPTKEKVNDYIAQLTKKIPKETSGGLQIPPTRQKPTNKALANY
ncbi:hypothetical protein [Prochlorococcus marinus]|uniref:hypothetical protein n=1 Tax=Prochlorococcus marinus TaxID=1219 RepID=UPI0000672A08|nr:hypothetical protein [Prochlorococcus marinus]